MSIGGTLAETRRRAGLTVADVSASTRIREALIQGIEQDEFDSRARHLVLRRRSDGKVVGTTRVVPHNPALSHASYMVHCSKNTMVISCCSPCAQKRMTTK